MKKYLTLLIFIFVMNIFLTSCGSRSSHVSRDGGFEEDEFSLESTEEDEDFALDDEEFEAPTPQVAPRKQAAPRQQQVRIAPPAPRVMAPVQRSISSNHVQVFDHSQGGNSAASSQNHNQQASTSYSDSNMQLFDYSRNGRNSSYSEGSSRRAPASMRSSGRSISSLGQGNFKHGYFSLKKSCKTHAEPNESSQAFGTLSDKRTLWVRPSSSENWVTVLRKAGPAYMKKSCF